MGAPIGLDMGWFDSALITIAERLYYVPHRRAHVADWLVARLRRPAAEGRLLDFGGGTGQVAAELSVRLGGRIVVADVDATALASVPIDRALAPVLVPPNPPLPFADSAFHGIFLVDVLHHVADRAGTLAELGRCLAPGGLLAIVEFEPDRPATRLFRRFARLGGRDCLFETRERLAERLSALDLSPQTQTLDGLRYGVTARSPAPR